jgi:hypothetical protein
MSVHVAAGPHHTYRANEHDTVLSEVASVLCVLMPRAFLVAGLNEEGKVVMIRYNSYATTDPEWEPRFFEHEFMTETLLGVPEQVKAVFVGSEQAMLIPESFYEEGAARNWIEKLQIVSPTDVLHTHKLATPDAQYAFMLPAAMDKLLHRYFAETPILPVAAYQFHKPNKNGALLQCLIAEHTVVASLHQNGNLLWHNQFSYTTAEDIAWQAAYLCRELHVPRIDLNIQATMLCDSCYGLTAELEQYFPRIKWSVSAPAEGGDWSPVVYLLQQLYACAL